MVDLGQKKVNSHSPFFIAPNPRGVASRDSGEAFPSFLLLIYSFPILLNNNLTIRVSSEAFISFHASHSPLS
jgi:hypothetical protein